MSENDQRRIDELYRTLKGGDKNGHHKRAPSVLEDDDLLEVCRKARNAAKFASLFDDGDLSAYDGDDSRADEALIAILAFYTQDPGQLDRLFRRSALYRQKWERADYRRRTIDFALEGLTDNYTPPDDGARLNAPGSESTCSHQDGGVDENKKLMTILASAVTPVKVEWLWEKRIPRGKLTIFDGDPDMGKSVVTIDIAARVSTGHGFPDGAKCEPANVCIVNVEDGVEDTIVPRLIAAGADLEKVHILQGVDDGNGGRRLIDIPGDVGTLQEYIEANDIELLIIDPVLTMLAKDANKDQDARKALAPVRDMAERTGCAVVAVRHLNKNVTLNAIQRGGGNMGLIGVARAGAFFAKHPEDDFLRVMAPHKSNLAKKQPALAYRIVSANVHETARLEWVGTVEHDADTLAAAGATTPAEQGVLDDAIEFLKDELGEGPMWAKQVYKDARDAGVSDATLKRAKVALKVRSEKIGTEGWAWSLPGKEAQFRIGARDEHVEHLEHLPNKNTTQGMESPYLSEGAQHAQGAQGAQARHGEHLREHLPKKTDEVPASFNLEPGESATVAELKERRRLTEEKAREVQKRMSEGASAKEARAEVLGEEERI